MSEQLLLSDYDYYLPEELIAQSPAEKRDHSRLFVLDRQKSIYEHKRFYDITEYLKEGDALVINNSKVIPARLLGNKIRNNQDNSKGPACEVLLLKQKEKDVWETLVRPGKKLPKGSKITFGELLLGEVVDVLEDGNRLIRFSFSGEFFSVIDKVGKLPLPPYITNDKTEGDRYQTIYAAYKGSSAAPTAGLHFTDALLDKIKEKGVFILPLTLHVGLGTFRPVKENDITKHKMHSEYYDIPQQTAEIYNKVRENKGRIFAVGTTSCRTLESALDEKGRLKAGSGNTDIFIYPGRKLNAVDSLITNFHLPQSTLLMLISALAGRERILDAYSCAIKEKYRFYSFGDAMLIL